MTQVRLFIQTFRKRIVPIVEIIIFTGILFISGKGINYLLVDDTKSYTRVMMHEMYDAEENIDLLFLGSSHCYRSFDTKITDKITGVNTFNAGTSSQNFDGTYALLVEAEKYHDLDAVVLELYYDIAGSSMQNRSQLTSTYLISDYMKPSLNKLRYLLNASGKEHYVNSFFIARRNWEKLFEKDYISKIYSGKMQDSYKNYEYVDNGKEYYAGKGFVANIEEIAPGTFVSEKSFKEIMDAQITADNVKAINDIIKYCKKKDIKLTVVSAPVSDFMLCGVGNYDSYIEQVKAVLEPHGIEYYDFNLCREEFFSYQDDYFMDTHHLNAKGAEAFSTLFSKFYTGEIGEKELFYNSYDEKISNHKERIYGLITNVSETEDGTEKMLSISPVDNTEKAIYYRITKTAENSTEEIRLQDFDVNSVLYLPKEENGTVNIEATFDHKKYNCVTIKY